MKCISEHVDNVSVNLRSEYFTRFRLCQTRSCFQIYDPYVLEFIFTVVR